MPTVLRVDGFRVLILLPPREHGPPHVHVVKNDGVAVVRLEDASKGISHKVVRVERMRLADLRAAERIVAAHTVELLGRWRELHG